tara:strand:+ start:3124 stop:3981 length:858 start_codon:yes stop_codon:yes gene_type:complete
MYALLDRVYGKWARRHAQRMAIRYQRSMFVVYLTKYVKKHMKLRTRDAAEHAELIPYIERYVDRCERVVSYLREHQKDLIVALRDAFCVGLTTKGSSYYYHPRYAPLRRIVRDRARIHVMRDTRDTEIRAVLEDIVAMAADLRFGFVASDTAAKTKIREHWIQRPPPLALFIFIVLSLRVFFGTYTKDFHAFGLEDAMYLIFTGMGLTSMYMLYLRVPQCICAEAKKSAQEVYANHKTNLHLNLLDAHGDMDEYMRREADAEYAIVTTRRQETPLPIPHAWEEAV